MNIPFLESRASRSLLAAALTFLPALSLAHDVEITGNQQGYFLEISDSFKELLGFSEYDLTHLPIFNFMHPEDIEPTVNQMQEQIEKKQGPNISITNRYRSRSGHYYQIEWFYLNYEADGRVVARGRVLNSRL